MLSIKHWVAVLVLALLPVVVFGAGIPGLEGLREVSDDDLEEICGSIMPDDKSQMILSRRNTAESQQDRSVRLRGQGQGMDPAGALPAAPGQGGFDVKAYAQSIAGKYVTADVDTSGLRETVTPHTGNLSDMLTPGALLGSGGGFGSQGMGMDYAAQGVVEISGPKVMGVDMSQMGDLKASMGVRVSATVSVTP